MHGRPEDKVCSNTWSSTASILRGGGFSSSMARKLCALRSMPCLELRRQYKDAEITNCAMCSVDCLASNKRRPHR